jgi:hypothetical protein
MSFNPEINEKNDRKDQGQTIITFCSEENS